MENTIKVFDEKINRIIYGYEKGLPVVSDFDKLAVEIARYQYKHNDLFRGLCEKCGINCSQILRLEDIPILPVSVFKQKSKVTSIPIDKNGIEMVTSGTTSGKHGLIYREPGFFFLREKAILSSGSKDLFSRFYPNKVQIIFLDFPNRRRLPDFPINYSVLANYARFFGTEDSIFLDPTIQSDEKCLVDNIRLAKLTDRPIVILGPSYRISHIVGGVVEGRIDELKLPPGSMVMDSGGLKNRGYHQDYSKYVANLLEVFNITRRDYVNTYTLSEIGSHFSDMSELPEAEIYKKCPPWTKVRLVTVKDIDVAVGERGEIIIYDLLNRGTILALRTGDYGIRTTKGFKIQERGAIN